MAILRFLLVTGLAGGAFGLAYGCGTSHPPIGVGGGGGSPTPGDACDTPGQTSSCHAQVSQGSGFVNCVVGTTTCTNGVWGACVSSSVTGNTFTAVLAPASRDKAAGGIHTAADPTLPLPDAGACVVDPCDPYCLGWDENDGGTVGGGGTGDPGSGGPVSGLKGGWDNTQPACVTGGGANALKCPDDQCCPTTPVGICQAWAGATPNGDCVPAAGIINFTSGVGCNASNGHRTVPVCNRGAIATPTAGKVVVGFKSGPPPLQAPFNANKGYCSIDLATVSIAADSCFMMDLDAAQAGVTCFDGGGAPAAPLGLPSKGGIYVNAGAGSQGNCASYSGVCCSNDPVGCVTDANQYDNIGVWDWGLSCSTLGVLGPPGLTRAYPLDNDLKDYGGSGADLTAHGGNFTKDRFGKDNMAYYMDGFGDYLDDGNNYAGLPMGGVSRTISFWVRPDYVNSITAVVDWGDHVIANEAFGLGFEATNFGLAPVDIKFWGAYDDACGFFDDCNLHFTAGNWTFEAAVYDSTTPNQVVLYKDSATTTQTLTGFVKPLNTVPNNSMLVGQRGYGQFLKGAIDDIRVYNRALTPNEIGNVMSGSASAEPIGPFNYTGVCDPGFHVKWKYLQYDLTAMGTGGVSVEGFTTPTLIDGAVGTMGMQNTLANLGSGVAHLGPAVGASGPDSFPASCHYATCSVLLDVALANNANDPLGDKLTLTFEPQGSQSVSTWKVSYDCIPYE